MAYMSCKCELRYYSELCHQFCITLAALTSDMGGWAQVKVRAAAQIDATSRVSAQVELSQESL